MSFDKYLATSSLKDRFYDKLIKGVAIGTDGIHPKKFEKSLDDEIELIQRKVTNMTYRFSRFHEMLILKNKFSRPRAVYIPTVRDRLVLNAMNAYLKDKFQQDLQPHQLSVKANVTNIIRTLKEENFDAFIKLDVKNFFPSLDHEILFNKLQTRIEDKTALSLLKKVLNRSQQGIAPGLSIAGQLADIYINDVDKSLSDRPNFKYFRFVDDILILCNSTDVKAIHAEIEQKTNDLRLKLHDTATGGKSDYGNLHTDTLEYLGFSFLGNQISVRESSVEKLRKRIRQVFTDTIKDHQNNKKAASESTIIDFIDRLNLKITGCLYNNKAYGWLFFFRDINDLTLLNHLDWFVKKCFDNYGVEYEPTEVKSFVKTYFALKSLDPEKLDANSYIPSFDSNSVQSLKTKNLCLDDLNDVEDTPIPAKKAAPTEYYQTDWLEKFILGLANDVEIY